jgi:hypothetical protein
MLFSCRGQVVLMPWVMLSCQSQWPRHTMLGLSLCRAHAVLMPCSCHTQVVVLPYSGRAHAVLRPSPYCPNALRMPSSHRAPFRLSTAEKHMPTQSAPSPVVAHGTYPQSRAPDTFLTSPRLRSWHLRLALVLIELQSRSPYEPKPGASSRMTRHSTAGPIVTPLFRVSKQAELEAENS